MNLTNLFNHQKDKKGFVTVMNVLLKDITTKEPLLKLDSLKISNIAVEGNEKEIRGGLGAGLLMTYGYGRTATVEIEDAFEDGVDTPEAVAELTEQVQSALADQINVHAQTLLVLTESKKAYFKKALKAKQGRN